MLQPALTSVTAARPLTLRLTYETGEEKLFDVSPYADGPWYGELRDPSYFRAVRLLPGGTGIEWPHGQDIAPHELYELGRNAGDKQTKTAALSGTIPQRRRFPEITPFGFRPCPETA